MLAILQRTALFLLIVSAVCTCSSPAAAEPILLETPSFCVVKAEYRQDNHKIFIPQLQNMDDAALQEKINANIETAILSQANPAEGSSLHGTAEVSLATKQLLGIHFTGSSYTPGSAHPNKIDCGIHINLATGEIYRLSDLFRADADFMKDILDRCETVETAYRISIPGLRDHWTFQTFASAWQHGSYSFLLEQDSLRIYTIPSNAVGAIGGCKIPYSDLMDIIATDGSLWQNLQ